MPPFSCAKARNGILYGVNGAGRGFRWHPSFGKQDIGLSAPTKAPTARSTGASSSSFTVQAIRPQRLQRAVQVIDGENIEGEDTWVEAANFAEVPVRFKYPPTLESVGGGGQGGSTVTGISGVPSPVFLPTVEGGAVTSIGVQTQLAGHSSAPSIVITGDGTGATATGVITDGALVAVAVTDGGAGYTKLPTVSAQSAGPLVKATAQGLLRAGVLSGATITNPGAGFGSLPNFAVTYKYDADAEVAATLRRGYVHSIAVTNGGSGYTSASVTIAAPAWTGPTPPTATATATVSGGAVTGITVTYGGEHYTSVPAVTISGDGAGATATATCRFGLTLTVTKGGDSYALGSFGDNPPFPGLPTGQRLVFSGHSGPGPVQYNKLSGPLSDTFVVNETGTILAASTTAHGFETAPTKITVSRIPSLVVRANAVSPIGGAQSADSGVYQV